MLAQENMGVAERLLQTVLTFTDHAVHNRPGMVTKSATNATGVLWEPVTHKVEDGKKVVYKLHKPKGAKKTTRIKVGVCNELNQIKNDAGVVVADYRPAGLFPEVVTWLYRQVAEVWKLDNEFAAKWASYQWGQEHRDLKVILAAFMLVQSRKGDPVMDAGKVAFFDEDFRGVGEAMLLLRAPKQKGKKEEKGLDPKHFLRIYDVLSLPSVASINRELGFGKSARRPFLGRWDKAVEKWLANQEQNPKLLEALVRGGWRSTVMELARKVGYKPTTPRFFATLRWKQAQAEDGRRTVALGQEVKAAETWAGLDEMAICERIVAEKPSFKRLVGLLPSEPGMTRAIMAAAIESGAMSDKDLVIATPTIEELGLLEVQDIRERWERACKAATDMRAANIARNVKTKEVAEKLVEAADEALQKEVAEVVKDMQVWVIVDISDSMKEAIDEAKALLCRFVQGFPLDRIHVSVFSTAGREIPIKHASAPGVENAFRGIHAGGGTHYAQGVKALAHHKPKADEDLLMIFVGDEECSHPHFVPTLQGAGLKPMAFGLIKPRGNGSVVRTTAAMLGIPCFEIKKDTFNDPYAIPRTIKALVAATPVGVTPTAERVKPRVTLVDTILKVDLLKKPAWAA